MRILGIIAVLAAVGMGALSANRNFTDAKDAKEMAPTLEQYRTELEGMKEQVKQLSGFEADSMNEQIAEAEKMLAIPSSGTFMAIGILMVVLALISLIAGVFLFKPGHKIAVMLLGAAIVAGLVAIIISPNISTEYGPASNRTLSIIVTVPAVLATLFAFAMRNGKKQPAQA
ncbi:hypothetical protein [uncultured Flavobacterium sp.]|uniref:hypothetical protein n=1 Tax=uncultured Flavobacterium sp. TaxID=165435 RepID=UPI0025D35F9F|nr:hypothetical protein [uncultured Flavobacterium sp.]